jgi:transcriptional regulator with XRE-family HTH domain
MTANGLQRNPTRIGHVLRERRSHHGWTLAEVAAKTGVSRSTLSKLENDLITPSYQTILQLCSGLGIEISDLVGRPREAAGRPVIGRRSISRGRSGCLIADENYRYTYLCTEVAHKRIVPIAIDISANSVSAVSDLWSHEGEEFVYVLEGAIRLHTEFYEAEVLEAGDCAYFDSTMEHAYVSASERPARLLVMCSSATPNLAQTLRDMLKQRLNGRAS